MIDLSTFQYIKLKFSIIDLWNSSLILKTRLASYPSSFSLSAHGRKEKGVCMGTRLRQLIVSEHQISNFLGEHSPRPAFLCTYTCTI